MALLSSSLVVTVPLLLLSFFGFIGNVAVHANTQNLDDAIISTMDWLKIRGASIAFYDKIGLLYQSKNKLSEPIIRGYGYLSGGINSGNVTPDTTFMIASVSKIFAGLSVLLLIDQGYIGSLDDDICNVIPADYDRSACRNPNYPNIPVTWRMLITHRSSLRPDIPSFANGVEAAYAPTGGYIDGSAAGQDDCPMEDVIGFYRDFMINKETETIVGDNVVDNWYQLGQSKGGGAWKNYKPGSRRRYSNFAVGYIAALVEHVTGGQSFPNFCKENIFEPLQMDHTAWFRRDLPVDTIEAIPNEWIRRNIYRDYGHYCFIDYASGSLHTSARDLSKFFDAYLDDYASILFSNNNNNSLDGGEAALQCLEKKPNGSVPSSCEFGANWILMDNSSKRNAEFWLEPYMDLDWTNGGMHDGYEAGTQAQVVILPEAGVYAVVLTNTDMNDDWAAQELAYDIMDSQG